MRLGISLPQLPTPHRLPHSCYTAPVLGGMGGYSTLHTILQITVRPEWNRNHLVRNHLLSKLSADFMLGVNVCDEKNQ